MRVLGVGHDCDLGALYQRLQASGHEVRVHVDDRDSRGLFAGILNQTANYRDELPWIREAGREGLILFEGTGWGKLQDTLREEGFNVVGGSEIGDRLETDRRFGQDTLAALGLRVANTVAFSSFDHGIAHLRHSRQRCVLKFNGSDMSATRTYIGQLEDGSDVLAMLELTRARWTFGPPSFVLMEHIEGVEVGVGAFFNGEKFLLPANLDWEHKHFFAGDLGELTGEMGTLATYRGAQPLFEASLAKLAPTLRASRYCGYVNLNTIVNCAGIWPLELTCRFGYPGFTLLDALHVKPWAEVLTALISGEETLATRDGYSVGVVLTVPPFPYRDGYERLSKGLPICFRGELTEEQLAHVHLGEVALENGKLVTDGVIGYAMVVTGVGTSVQEAQSAAYTLSRKVVIPNLRYRHDIGERFLRTDQSALQRMGWLT